MCYNNWYLVYIFIPQSTNPIIWRLVISLHVMFRHITLHHHFLYFLRHVLKPTPHKCMKCKTWRVYAFAITPGHVGIESDKHALLVMCYWTHVLPLLSHMLCYAIDTSLLRKFHPHIIMTMNRNHKYYSDCLKLVR